MGQRELKLMRGFTRKQVDRTNLLLGRGTLCQIKELTENAEFGVSPKFFGLLTMIESATSSKRTNLQHYELAHPNRYEIPLISDPQHCLIKDLMHELELE